MGMTQFSISSSPCSEKDDLYKFFEAFQRDETHHVLTATIETDDNVYPFNILESVNVKEQETVYQNPVKDTDNIGRGRIVKDQGFYYVVEVPVFDRTVIDITAFDGENVTKLYEHTGDFTLTLSFGERSISVDRADLYSVTCEVSDGEFVTDMTIEAIDEFETSE